MPVCEGRPGQACPDNRNDKTVHLSQGDLMLCDACECARFGQTLLSTSNGAAKKSSKTQRPPDLGPETSAVTSKSNTTCDGAITRTLSTSDHCPATLVRRNANIFLNKLLTYATFYRDNSSGADLHGVIISF